LKYACARKVPSSIISGFVRLARNTLANANAVRDWRIYADFAQSLIGIGHLSDRISDRNSGQQSGHKLGHARSVAIQ
jgi:hypothetical protein